MIVFPMQKGKKQPPSTAPAPPPSVSVHTQLHTYQVGHFSSTDSGKCGGGGQRSNRGGACP